MFLSRILIVLLCIQSVAFAQQRANKPEREKWFSGLGFGMFIHWSVDAQLGAVISHSLAGASGDYRQKFFTELPATFNPRKFNPDEWAELAHLAGMKYMVFTAKHHSGFCMYNTASTPFNSINTPFKRDITKEVITAFRKQGIAIGLYFSPEDFYYLDQTNVPVGRLQHPLHYPVSNPGLMAYDKSQLKELLSNYGKIDIIFLDGPAEGLKEYCWQLQPDIVVTRGEMNTPEQKIPDAPVPAPWESCLTMGTDWQFKPTNDKFKTGTELINTLIETRAKGGNLLLNVGPRPDGTIRDEEDALLREISLWNFANAAAIHHTRAGDVIRDGDTWYTRSLDGKIIYACVTRSLWKYGERKELLLPSLSGSEKTRVTVLGYASQLVEYRENFDAAVRITPGANGLLVSAVNGQRFYTDNKWPNPVVLQIEGASFRGSAAGSPQKAAPKDKKQIDGAL